MKITNEVVELRQQLATARRQLKAVLDARETATEQLQVANEEIEAGNQELKSTNEELEASRQTIQATNEALTTLNAELEARNHDLAALLAVAEKARSDATIANNAKSAFLANISHDLRTPLNAISGYADLLELLVHGPLNVDQTNDVGRIKRSSRYLLSLINDLLNFAKVGNGILDLRTERVEVDDAVKEIAAMLSPMVRQRGLTFVRCETHACVFADADKIQQVLLNLASNAIKFTPQGGGITVSCSTTDSVVRILVTDTGVGIATSQLERIFEPFIQVNRSLTNVNHEGVGLGLSISRELARAMGGDITVESVVGQGSTFSLALPRA